MRSNCFILLISAFLLTSCHTTSKVESPSGKSQDKLLMAVSWYQNSGEMMALYYQGFNIARQRIDEAVTAESSAKPLAVVVDIDETMLDNSPFETILMNSADFQKGWYDWTSKASAKATPGALEFARYAQSKNVEIYYITNRDDKEREATLKNLQFLGFPFADNNHLYTRHDFSVANGNTSSKDSRRAKVAENHEIILLIGDNLNDFSGLFENRHENYGKQAVENSRDQFGRKFIILPNPMYGAWEKPLYDYRDGLSEDQKTELFRSKLRKE